MLFKKTRTLKDKVFSTTISFVDYGKRDGIGAVDVIAKKEEQDLIDNFGAPLVSVGKQFTGHVKLVDNKVTLVEQTETDAICISYILSEKQIDVAEGFSTSLAIDAKKEVEIFDDLQAVKLTKEQHAEAKCLVFETIIEKRLVIAVESLKAKVTAFESEVLDEIIIPLPTTPVHNH